MNKKDRIREILNLLKKHYPDAKTRLDFKNNYECIVAVSLSARTTDNQVNKITPELFQSYGDFYKLSSAKPSEIEALINKCGLYKSKSRNLVEMARIIVNDYHGDVPSDIIELMTLPGVGRKTANVVRSTLFNQPAIAVDTHVFRVSRRLGLATGKDTIKVEKELMEIIPKKDWSKTHHQLITHGREICHSRKPLCDNCFLKNVCPKINLKDS